MATVGPAGPKATRGGRRRTLILTTIVGMGALVVGTVVVNRAAGTSRATGPESTDTVPAAFRFPATTPSTRKRPPTTVARTTVPTSPSSLATPPTTGFLVVTPPGSGPDPTDPVDTVPPTTIPTPTTVLAPAVTATLPPPPPPFGAGALTWTAPKTLVIVAGATAPLSVKAYNPTGRSASLSHPLSCTPRLDHGEACADIVQLIGSHRSAAAHYTIDASDTAPGDYTLTIEGVLTVDVTVS